MDGRQAGGQAGQAGRRTGRRKGMRTGGPGRQADRQAGGQAGGQEGGQADRQVRQILPTSVTSLSGRGGGGENLLYEGSLDVSCRKMYSSLPYINVLSS